MDVYVIIRDGIVLDNALPGRINLNLRVEGPDRVNGYAISGPAIDVRTVVLSLEGQGIVEHEVTF